AERAAYLLRRLFDYEYDELAGLLGRSQASCRQLVSRAEAHLEARRPRFESDPAQARRLTDAFLHTCSTGDLEGLKGLLAADAVLYSDGGGKVAAALVPIEGAERVARLFLGLYHKLGDGVQVRRVLVNGQPGLWIAAAGEAPTVLTFVVGGGKIRACYAVRNP